MKEENKLPTSNEVVNPQQETINPSTPPIKEAPISLFTQVVKCKEITKELMDKPLESKDTSKMNEYYDLVSVEQQKCLKLIETLSNESAKAEDTAKLQSALSKSKDRIAVENKQISFLRKDTHSPKELENMGYLNLGISLVRDQELTAWQEYKTYLEDKKANNSDEGGLMGPLIIVLIAGIIMAIARRRGSSQGEDKL